MIFSNWDQKVYYPKTEKFVWGKVFIKKKTFQIDIRKQDDLKIVMSC